jgi:hypothetical protein
MRGRAARRVVTAGTFVALVAAGPAAAHFVAATSHPAQAVLAMCADGETEDLFTDNCVPELTPTTSGESQTVSAPVVAGPNDSGAITESDPGDPESLPEIDNIPITDPSVGIGLEESAQDSDIPVVDPHSTLSSSP